MGRFAATALTLLAACTALVAPTAARAASSGEYFGTNLQTLGAAPQASWNTFYDSLVAEDMHVNRLQVDWRLVEPTSPASNGGKHVYDWRSVDGYMRGLAQRGLRLAPLFRWAPRWAATGSGATFNELPPASYDDFGLMVAAFAQRYGPGGTFWAANPTIPARPTLTYELWNEANLDEYAWNGKADAVAYAALLKTARPIIKAVQPGAMLLGSLAWQSKITDGQGVHPDFVANLGAAGGLAALDGMGYHPYAPDAQSIFDLVVPLHAELAAAGAPNLPIFANETGQPVKYGELGNQYAYQGFTSDAARGANLAFAGEALALSDCEVEQFLPYSIIATLNPEERLNEGFMGLFYKDSAKPNETAQALGRASARWIQRATQAAPAPGDRLALCSQRPSPVASLLPIKATFAGTEAVGCVTANASYDGNPLESAYLRLRQEGGGELASARTDARGNATACVEPFLLGQPFRAVVDVQKAGTSGAVLCNVPNVGCPAGVSFSPAIGETLVAQPALVGLLPGGPAGPAARGSSGCDWALTTKRLSSRPAPRGATRLKLRARLDCATRKPGTVVRFVLSTKSKRAKRETRVRSVHLKTGVPTEITIVRRLRKTDLIVLLHREGDGSDVPRIRTTLSVSAPIEKR